MKIKDEELQNNIDKGFGADESEDTRAYQHVFNALRKEPDFHVSLAFADRIVSFIDRREEKSDYWWIVTGVFFCVIAMIVALALTNVNWSAGVFTFLSGYPGLVVFGIAFILVLQWIDRAVIKKKLTS